MAGIFDEMKPVLPDTEEYGMLDSHLFSAYPPSDHPDRAAKFAYSMCPLEGYDDMWLARVTRADDQGAGAGILAVLRSFKFLIYLSGQAEDIYTLNNWAAPQLDDKKAVATYVRNWMSLTNPSSHGELIESANELESFEREIIRKHNLFPFMSVIKPIHVHAPDAHGRHNFEMTVKIDGRLHPCAGHVWPDGLVQLETPGETISYETMLLMRDTLRPFSSIKGSSFANKPRTGASDAACALQGVVTWEEHMPQSKGIYERMTEGQTPDESYAEEQRTAMISSTPLSDTFEKIAEILLDHAVAQDFPVKRGMDAMAGFVEYVRTYRPIVMLETPYRELRSEFGRLLARKCGLGFDDSRENDTSGGFRSNDYKERIMLFNADIFRNQTDGETTDCGAILAPVLRSPNVALIVGERFKTLRQDARDMIDLTVRMTRMDAAQFWACADALFGPSTTKRRPKVGWIRYVQPRDIARVAAATKDRAAYLAELEATVKRRLAQYTAPDAPSLSHLAGLGEARYRFEELAHDISAAIDGEIDWTQVDRGYLLVGPPGTGKTTLVRALAKDCGIRFVLASASAWQEGGSLGPHIQNIRASFREARLYAPAIMFIDEIDSLGSRGHIEEKNSQYQTVVINTVLEELQGFEGREGVIVIGATNNPGDVDEAIRRPGRLDRMITVPYPNIQALASIYTYYLDQAADKGLLVDDIDVDRLAQLSFGRTGAHIELYVRAAERKARRARTGRIAQVDLLAEITNRPPDGFGIHLSPEMMQRTAIHEAGHALISLTGPLKALDLPMASITPRADGTLGFVARAPGEIGAQTREIMQENIRVLLGGRAAEELRYGAENVSGGAGGGESSDLAKATDLVMLMLTEFGFSKAGGLLWIDWRGRGSDTHVTAEAIRNLPMGDDILREAHETIDRLYRETLDRLTARRDTLERIAEALIAKQELSSAELHALAVD